MVRFRARSGSGSSSGTRSGSDDDRQPTRRAPSLGWAATLLACSAAVVGPVMAQEAVERRFEQLDRDKDGAVTPDELPAKTVFRRLDLDGDGAITKSEAMDAVRQGALADLPGRRVRSAARRSGESGPISDAPTPHEPPIRAGPKTVRPGDHGIGRRIADVTFVDLAGTRHSLKQVADGRITVVAMTSTSCPLSRKYLPTVEGLVAANGDAITWVLVNPVATDTPADMQATAAGFAGRAIYVHDAGGGRCYRHRRDLPRPHLANHGPALRGLPPGRRRWALSARHLRRSRGPRPDGAGGDRPWRDAAMVRCPDAVFEFAKPVAVKAKGVMPYQTVIVETHLPEDHWVRTIEVRPPRSAADSGASTCRDRTRSSTPTASPRGCRRERGSGSRCTTRPTARPRRTAPARP